MKTRIFSRVKLEEIKIINNVVQLSRIAVFIGYATLSIHWFALTKIP